MSIKIGDVDVAKEIVELNYQVIRTQLILEAILNANPTFSSLITRELIDQIEEKAVEQLKRKFPNMGIMRNPSA